MPPRVITMLHDGHPQQIINGCLVTLVGSFKNTDIVYEKNGETTQVQGGVRKKILPSYLPIREMIREIDSF